MQPRAHRHVSPLLLFQKPQDEDVKKYKVHSWSLAHLFIISKPLTCYNTSRQSSPTNSLRKAAGSFTRCPRSGKQSLPAHTSGLVTPGPLALVTNALRAITNVCIEFLSLFSTELARGAARALAAVSGTVGWSKTSESWGTWLILMSVKLVARLNPQNTCLLGFGGFPSCRVAAMCSGREKS